MNSYEYYKSRGICTYCRKRKAVEGKSLCYECAERENEKARKKYQSMSDEEKRENRRKENEARKKQRDERKRLGLCIVCGKPAYKNYTRCYEHYLYSKRWYREHKKGKL